MVRKAPAELQRHLPQAESRTQAEMDTTKVAAVEAVASVVAVVTGCKVGRADQVVSHR